MGTLSGVYRQAIRDSRAIQCKHFYEVHSELVREYAERYGVPLANACIAYARLSPRTSVALNNKAYVALIQGNPKPSGMLTGNWQLAQQALSLSAAETTDYLYSQPLTKVRAFARNLLLDDSVITLDSIMLRILKDFYPIRNHNHLFQHYANWHTDIYPAIRALDPATPPYQIQAILWEFARKVYTPLSPRARVFGQS